MNEARIAHGIPVTTNQFPFIASLMIPVNGQFVVCAGSIISRIWVLTAAHCTHRRNRFRIRYGTIFLAGGGEVQDSTMSLEHHRYNPFTLENDISIVRIPRPITISASVQIIQMPTLRQQTVTFLGQTAHVAGWGLTMQGQLSSRLNRAVLQVASNIQCRQLFGNINIADTVLCAGHPRNQGHCAGDDGAPLFIREGAAWTQIGVASFTRNNRCGASTQTGFIRTSRYLQWLNMYAQIPLRH